MDAADFATMPLEQFALRGRFVPPNGPRMPAHHLAEIRPLSSADARRLWGGIWQARLHRQVPFTAGFFRTVESTEIGDDPDEERRVRKWLYRRGVPFRQLVLLSYTPDWAVVTPWKILVKYWSAFYQPAADDLTVIDGTFQWALLFHHEDWIFFGRNGSG